MRTLSVLRSTRGPERRGPSARLSIAGIEFFRQYSAGLAQTRLAADSEQHAELIARGEKEIADELAAHAARNRPVPGWPCSKRTRSATGRRNRCGCCAGTGCLEAAKESNGAKRKAS